MSRTSQADRYSDRQRLPPIASLRRARTILVADGNPEALSVVHAIDRILAGGDPRQALGLKAQAGARAPINVDRNRARDELIREMAERHFSRSSARERARLIDTAARRYERRLLHAHAALKVVPASYLGTPTEYLFRIARLPAEVPGWRHLQRILALVSY